MMYDTEAEIPSKYFETWILHQKKTHFVFILYFNIRKTIEFKTRRNFYNNIHVICVRMELTF